VVAFSLAGFRGDGSWRMLRARLRTAAQVFESDKYVCRSVGQSVSDEDDPRLGPDALPTDDSRNRPATWIVVRREQPHKRLSQVHRVVAQGASVRAKIVIFCGGW
jgi:hypothetical protein